SLELDQNFVPMLIALDPGAHALPLLAQRDAVEWVESDPCPVDPRSSHFLGQLYQSKVESVAPQYSAGDPPRVSLELEFAYVARPLVASPCKDRSFAVSVPFSTAFAFRYASSLHQGPFVYAPRSPPLLWECLAMGLVLA
ncbi:hypothetical protein H0H93_002739, partial [Arthromyces matolae]